MLYKKHYLLINNNAQCILYMGYALPRNSFYSTILARKHKNIEKAAGRTEEMNFRGLPWESKVIKTQEQVSSWAVNGWFADHTNTTQEVKACGNFRSASYLTALARRIPVKSCQLAPFQTPGRSALTSQNWYYCHPESMNPRWDNSRTSSSHETFYLHPNDVQRS